MAIFLKNSRFSGRIWLDWGNTAWADMAGLGSIGLYIHTPVCECDMTYRIYRVGWIVC